MKCKKCNNECTAINENNKAVSNCCSAEIDYDQFRSCSHPNFTGTTGAASDKIKAGNIVSVSLNNDGMSLRDYFAAKAMQGLISAHNESGEWTGAGDIEMNKIMAETAYSVADAMLKAREK
jgi:hypothetical protein